MWTLVSWVSRTCWNTLHLPFSMSTFFLGRLQKNHSEKWITHASLSSSTISFLLIFSLFLPLTHTFPFYFLGTDSHPPPLSSSPPFTLYLQFSSLDVLHLVPPIFPLHLIFRLFLPSLISFPYFSSFSLLFYHLLSSLCSFLSLSSLSLILYSSSSWPPLHTLLYLLPHTPPSALPSPLVLLLSRLPLSQDTNLTHGLLISESNTQTYSRCRAHKSAHRRIWDTHMQSGSRIQGSTYGTARTLHRVVRWIFRWCQND